MSGLDILLVTLAMTILHGKNQFSVSILPFCLCCMAQSQMMHWLGAFVLLCSLCFLLLNFSQWLSDKVLLVTLNMSIQRSLFGSNCSQALGQDSAICVSLEHGSDYSYYISSEQKWQKMLGHCFFCTWKTVAHTESFSTLTPQSGSLPLTEKLSIFLKECKLEYVILLQFLPCRQVTAWWLE